MGSPDNEALFSALCLSIISTCSTSKSLLKMSQCSACGVVMPMANLYAKDCIEGLIDAQGKDDLKLALELNEGIVCPTHFQQMDVGEAMSFFSHATAAGLRCYALKSQNEDIVSTAAFVDLIRTWFDLMTRRD